MKNLKFLLVISLVALLSRTTKGEVVHVRLDSTAVLTITKAFENGIPLDFDGKSYMDIRFRYDKWGSGEWFFHAEAAYNVTRVVDNGAKNSLGVSYAKILNKNDIVGSSSSFPTGFMQPLLGDHEDSNFLNRGDKYIGVEWIHKSNIHYCWIKLNLSKVDTTITLRVLEYAYEDIPGKSILVGDTVTAPTLVNSITVNGAGGLNTINTKEGSLQMLAILLPENADNKSVTWSVDDSSTATINQSGLLNAVSDGVVTVFAHALDGSGVSGKTKITITNQISTSYEAINAELDAVKVYQNNTGNLVVRSINDDLQVTQITLIDISGKILISKSASKTNQAGLSLSGIKTGIYFTRIGTNRGILQRTVYIR